jgi:hypothetical protein
VERYSGEERAAVERFVRERKDITWVVQLFNTCDRNEQATAALIKGIQ